MTRAGILAAPDILYTLDPTSPGDSDIHWELHSSREWHDNLLYIKGLYRIDHPILCCICTRTIHYNIRVGSLVKVCIDHIFHHKILNCNDIHPVVCNIHALDRNPFDTTGHHIDHLATLD